MDRFTFMDFVLDKLCTTVTHEHALQAIMTDHYFNGYVLHSLINDKDAHNITSISIYDNSMYVVFDCIESMPEVTEFEYSCAQDSPRAPSDSLVTVNLEVDETTMTIIFTTVNNKDHY